jgi:small GTP-binding protein
MIGAFAVGKTSLVHRFCQGVFTDRYLTTVGVKIDTAGVETSGGPVSLILWDLAGEDAFHSVQLSYLSGAHGLVYVVDISRHATLEVALGLRRRIEETMGKVPSIVLFNKCDLAVEGSEAELAVPDGLASFRTSAKTGAQVPAGFQALAELTLATPSVRLDRPRT